MTLEEAITIATHFANERNLPWESNSIRAVRRSLFTWLPHWKLESYVEKENATTRINVFIKDRRPVLVSVVYSR
jgi:hypothetical protein